jgi:hypothetical protein
MTRRKTAWQQLLYCGLPHQWQTHIFILSSVYLAGLVRAVCRLCKIYQSPSLWSKMSMDTPVRTDVNILSEHRMSTHVNGCEQMWKKVKGCERKWKDVKEWKDVKGSEQKWTEVNRSERSERERYETFARGLVPDRTSGFLRKMTLFNFEIFSNRGLMKHNVWPWWGMDAVVASWLCPLFFSLRLCIKYTLTKLVVI